jgi:hypothetical protein
MRGWAESAIDQLTYFHKDILSVRSGLWDPLWIRISLEWESAEFHLFLRWEHFSGELHCGPSYEQVRVSR